MEDSASSHGSRPDLSRGWSFLTLACIALIYVGTCFTPTIFDDNEGLYADAVKEMHASGDWLLPTSNGFPRVQKPPLVYWTMLVSTSLLGENVFALRLPNALATVGWICATYLIARRIGGERFGLIAAATLATMLGAWVFNHLIQPEPFLACFLSLAIWCLLEARNRLLAPRLALPWYLGFWACLALGTMSKGLHGALWPLGGVALCAAFFPGCRAWLRPVLDGRGLALFLALVLPWYVDMTIRLPGFLYAHFVNEQIGSSLNTRFPADAHQLPIWQFYAQHLLFWMPWTLLLPASLALVVGFLRNKLRLALSTPATDSLRLLAVLTVLILATVIFSTRQDYYSMSCWGFVAMGLAWPWIERRDRLRAAWLAVPAALVTLAGMGALGFAAWTQFKVQQLSGGSAAPIASRDTFMDALTGISPALWRRLLELLWIFGATTLIGGGATLAFLARRKLMPAFLSLTASAAVPIVLGTVGFTVMSPYFSLAESARAINRELALHPEATVACEALPNTASSLLYYLHARVHWVNAPFNNQYAQQVLGQGRDFYLDEAALLRGWDAGPVYFVIEQDRLDHWRARLPTGYRLVNESGTRLVLANRPG